MRSRLCVSQADARDGGLQADTTHVDRARQGCFASTSLKALVCKIERNTLTPVRGLSSGDALEVEVYKIAGEYQPADIFPKGVPRAAFERHRATLIGEFNLDCLGMFDGGRKW